MFTHISLFYLNDPADAPKLEALLNEVPGKNPEIVKSRVGINLTQLPEGVPGPEFCQVAQVLTFATEEGVRNYPLSKAHQDLLDAGSYMVAKVAAADFITED